MSDAELDAIEARADDVTPEPWEILALVAEVRRLRAQVAGHAERAGWQPIDTAPRDKELLLGWANDPDIMIGCCGYGQWGEVNRVGQIDAFDPQPTHWQPLPAPPP